MAGPVREIAVRGGTVVTSSDAVVADVLVRDGRIVAVGALDDVAATVIDATGCFVIPGGVDTHTHLENPSLGVTRSADDFETGTLPRRAAAPRRSSTS